MKNTHAVSAPARFRLPLALVLVLAAFLAAGPAWAQAISLRAPSLANVSGVLTARFGVGVLEPVVLKGELEDGAQLALRCSVSLRTARDYWFDGHLASATFVSTLSRDALSGEFVMALPGRAAPLRGKDIQALLLEGWGVLEVGLGPWDMLERGRKYRLSLDAFMADADAPEGLSRFIYFWSLDAGAGTSFQLDFTY
ncbi:DUF4390 domain-containing protein [Pseudodesulfovibrio sp. F-1]|uniref:DUF4390 domain-containing protein n=1 Tax=Pseudodesulfovibrio alkaliphilus TaxID=2661613 RepID=A0A7K1KN73_9BACT|nr:DUF4390 domain-containing protein [Pseudodesulfovibrio alkaliphilus]MUM77332.1 DUF4390 domain-containing protein [Pseudodesulfovibrio alkaliphilus]